MPKDKRLNLLAKFLPFILVISQAAICFADTITLKNKRSIEGIITKEEDKSVTLNVGFGTVVFQRSDIESIERSNEATNALVMEKWQERYFESFPAPTTEAQKLLDDFKDIQYSREKAVRNIRKRKNILKEISELQNSLPELQDALDKVGAELKSTDSKKDVLSYNSLVVEFNSLLGKMRRQIDRLAQLQQDCRDIDSQVSEYLQQLLDFNSSVEQRCQEVTADKPSKAVRRFYKNLKRRLASMQQDLRKESVGFRREGPDILIEALINNRFKATMLVDTGATLTVISKETAGRLGIESEEIKQTVDLIVADGRRIPAKFVTLNSVKVGELEARGVETAIVDIVLSRGVDGFLGMSYLKNFTFSIDAKGQKLILSSFEPKIKW